MTSNKTKELEKRLEILEYNQQIVEFLGLILALIIIVTIGIVIFTAW